MVSGCSVIRYGRCCAMLVARYVHHASAIDAVQSTKWYTVEIAYSAADGRDWLARGRPRYHCSCQHHCPSAYTALIICSGMICVLVCIVVTYASRINAHAPGAFQISQNRMAAICVGPGLAMNPSHRFTANAQSPCVDTVKNIQIGHEPFT